MHQRSLILTAFVVGMLLLASCSSHPEPTTEKASPAANPSANYEGFLEITDNRGISGWAWDKSQPDSPLQVTIFDGNKVLITLPADKFRKDLADNQRGNGKHGFETWLLSELKDGSAHQIRVKIANTDFELSNSPRSLTYSSKSN